MTSPSNIAPADRVAPRRKAPRPAVKPGAASRRGRLLPGLLAGALTLAGGGATAYWLLLPVQEAPRPRVATVKLGPLADMPDLRDGVPALMSKVDRTNRPKEPPPVLAAIQAKADGAPMPREAEEANRKAMASTIASVGLRPALPSQPAEAKTGASPAPAAGPVRSVSAPPPVPATTESPSPAPPAATGTAVVRRIDAKKPVEEAALQAAPVPPAPVSPPATVPPAAPPAVAPTPIQPALAPPATPPAPEPGSSEPVRSASLPASAPLPPPRPSFQAPEAATPERPARPADRASAKPRPAAAPRAPAQAAAAAQPVPAATPSEERSLLGIPVPGFIPSGRDIRDAANTITDAVTSLPSRF